MRAFLYTLRKNPGPPSRGSGLGHLAVGLNENVLQHLAAGCKSSELIVSSTGTDHAGWREFWRLHGTSWSSLLELHCEIVDRLRANSSLRVST
jgi:hypothetical protein